MTRFGMHKMKRQRPRHCSPCRSAMRTHRQQLATFGSNPPALAALPQATGDEDICVWRWRVANGSHNLILNRSIGAARFLHIMLLRPFSARAGGILASPEASWHRLAASPRVPVIRHRPISARKQCTQASARKQSTVRAWRACTHTVGWAPTTSQYLMRSKLRVTTFSLYAFGRGL